MSIQSSISGAIGAVGTTVAVGKALKQSDPEYQRKKQKEMELQEVDNEFKRIYEQISASGSIPGEKKTEFEKAWIQSLSDKVKDLSRRKFEADPSLENFEQMRRASDINKMAYTTAKQKRANNLATEQAKAKAQQKQTILTNIGKWEVL